MSDFLKDHTMRTGCPSDIRFSDRQAGAVRHKDGAMLVLAGPGSGKTAVITGRIRHLIHFYHIPPEHILTITFTKKAAIEMKQRAIGLCEEAGQAVFGTFHGVFYQILLTSPRYQGMSPCSLAVKRQLMKEILYANHYDSDQSIRLIDKLLQEISYCKNSNTDISKYHSKLLEKEQFEVIFHAYRKELHEKGQLDFDDMLLLCYDYLAKDGQARQKWQKKFQYIQIDEYQDINKIQYDMIKLLAGSRGNVFAVGDDDQAIYGFRGSNPELMSRFQKEYAPVKTVLLDKNYRCHQEIIQLAGQSIGHNKKRFGKKISGVHCNGEGVIIKEFVGEREETEAIISQIRRMKQEADGETIALLYRTNRHSAYMEEKLFQEGFLTERVEKRENFYERPIVSDVLAYFRFLESGKRYDFLQIMNKPLRYISRTALSEENVSKQELLHFYRGNRQMEQRLKRFFTELDFMRECDAYSAYLYLLKRVGYEAHCLKAYGIDAEKLQETKEDIRELGMRLKGFRTRKEFLDFAEAWMLGETKKGAVQFETAATEGKNVPIHLMTYHASKGLEFSHVFLPGVNKYIVPHKKAVTEEELEEERRMFYVAMTRAKNSLWISYRSENGTAEASPFVKELITNQSHADQ